MRLTQLWPAVATAVLLSSALGIEVNNGVNTTTPASAPSVGALWGKLFGNGPKTTRRAVLTGTNFNTNGTKLYFDPPGSTVTFRVLSSARITLFVRTRGYATTGGIAKPLKITAIDTGAGVVQINPEDGGLTIGLIVPEVNHVNEQICSRSSCLGQIDTVVRPPPMVRASSEAISRQSNMPLWVIGANFSMEYTELYFNPPLPEEWIDVYEVSRPDAVRIELKHNDLEPGPLKVVAIDTGSGLIHLNPEDGGIMVGMVLPTLSGGDITVNDDESLHIYQSTKQFQITGSGFRDNMKVLFTNGLCGGETRSTIHTKVGEQPDQLTVQLAEGYTWYDKLQKDRFTLPRPLELKSADAGKGWVQLGPTDAPGRSRTVAIVHEDPSINASDIDIFYGYTKELAITGAGFCSRRITQGDWTYQPLPTTLVFDPPIDLEIVEVFLREGYVTVLFPTTNIPQWAPVGYFGPLKVKGVDTGAGMVVLDPPVTVANIAPFSPFDFFLLGRINQLRQDGAIKHHEDRVDQAVREWQAMTLAEKAQAGSALMPKPSVKSTSAEIYARDAYCIVVEGANFSPASKLLFDPPLYDGPAISSDMLADHPFLEHSASTQRFISRTRIDVTCFDISCFLDWTGQLKVVAIDTGTRVVQVDPEIGGVVVATVMPYITLQGDENLLIYQSTKQIRIAGSGLEHAEMVCCKRGLHEEEAKFAITDTKPDELTLSLAEGDAWIKDPSSLPMALLVSSVDASPGRVFVDNIPMLRAQKVATVFEDPSIQASNVEIYRGFTRELNIHGTGFSKVVQPTLVFEPPLDNAVVNVHAVSRTMICLTLSATRADWTRAKAYLGPLKIEGIDTGAGMVFFDSPITVATVLPSAGMHDGKFAKVASNIDDLPSVDASSGELFMNVINSGITLRGTNFSLQPKLYFDSALPENAVQQFISSTEIAITREFSFDTLLNNNVSSQIAITRDFSFDTLLNKNVSSPWRAEPGPLKIVAMDIGAGRVELNPEGGGVVVATVLADVMFQPNEDLHIYQSIEQIQVTGSGFDNDIKLTYLGDEHGERTGIANIDTLSAGQITINLAEGSMWVKDPAILPGPLWMDCYVDLAGFESQTAFLRGNRWFFREQIATVFEEPSVDASEIEINRTGSQELVIWGTGFNDMVPTVMDFDPPLNFSNLHVNVVNRTTVQLTLDTIQSGWVPVEQLGPLKIKGVDTGAGMVVLDPPVTVATVVPDSKPLFKQGLDIELDVLELDSDKSTTPSLSEAKKAAEPEIEEFSEQVENTENTVLSLPTVEASSTVIHMGATDSLVVKGDNFNLATRLVFDPPLDRGFGMRVFSRTEIDVFVKYMIGDEPGTWRTEPGPLKVVAIHIGRDLVQLNPEEGGVVVAMVE